MNPTCQDRDLLCLEPVVYLHGGVPGQTVLDKVIYNGIAHHISMAYGEFHRPFEILARMKGWRVVK